MKEENVLKNLRITGKSKILVIDAPGDFQHVLQHLKFDSSPQGSSSGQYDYVQIFANNQEEMEAKLVKYQSRGKYDCMFWACYPKKSGLLKSDIYRETVWSALASIGLYAVTSVSINDDWSALRGRPDELVKKRLTNTD